jgi:HEAT repeat protein
VLSGWLYQTARLTAANFVKSEIRRRNREQEAYMQSKLGEQDALAWDQIGPLLDEAMGRLCETDRNAVVLSYFENKSAREVAATLKLNEAAAHKRVNRALERLRKFFTKRGVKITVTVIAGAVATNSVQSAPIWMEKSVTAAAITKGATASGSTLALIKGASKLIAWTKAKMAVAVGVGVLLGVATTAIIIKSTLPYDPMYQGKPVSYWFDLAVNATGADKVSELNRFLKIEGDAVLYLSSWVNAHPTAFDKAYQQAILRTPATFATKLPQPRTDDYYSARRNISLMLLEMIGRAQLWKSELGEPSSKPSITFALHSLLTTLADADTNAQSRAAEALGRIGSPAAPAIPELIKLARSTNVNGSLSAIQALGSIGPSGSNAISLLVEISGDPERDSVGIPTQFANDPSRHELWTQRLAAVRALGEIGSPESSVVRTLSSLLTDSDVKLRYEAVRSLASVGSTPDEAVPTLLQVKLGTNKIEAGFATLALWNHDRQDSKLKAEVAGALLEPSHHLIVSLGTLGTGAMPFESEIRNLVNDPNTNVQREARIALRKIKPQ